MGEPESYEIVNWDEFQKYTAKCPSWIKAYTGLLDKLEFRRLSDATKGHLQGLWLLRARLGKPIPNDQGYVRAMIGAHGVIDFESLVSAGFLKPCTILHNPAESCNFTALEEKRVEEKRIEKALSADADLDPIQSVHNHFNTVRGGKPLRLTNLRRTKYRARLRTNTPETLCRAIDAALADPFYRGDNDRQTRYDFPETVLKSDEAVERHLARLEPKRGSVMTAEQYAERRAARENSNHAELIEELARRRANLNAERV